MLDVFNAGWEEAVLRLREVKGELGLAEGEFCFQRVDGGFCPVPKVGLRSWPGTVFGFRDEESVDIGTELPNA